MSCPDLRMQLGGENVSVKNNPEDLGAMLESNEERKCGRLYRVESQQFAESRISDLVHASIKDLAALADGKQKISLGDTTALKERTIIYLRACESSGVLPSVAGLCRSLGCTRSGFYDYLNRNPDSPSGEWLALFQDVCSDLLATSALRGDVQPVVSIFLEEASYGMRETVEVIARSDNGPLGAPTTAEQLAARYAELPED